MSEENFEKEVESVSSELEQREEAVSMDDMTSEMQDQVRQLESLAGMDPEFANSEEYKDLMSSISNEGKEEVEAKSNEEAEETEEVEEEESDEPEDEDVFGLKKSRKKQKEFNVDFDVPDEMMDMISSKFGLDDPSKFFSSVDKWRSQAQEGAEYGKEYEALSTDLQSLPSEIKQSIQLWANGSDYTEAFNSNSRLDFSDDFRNQDTENLVQHYLEEEYNDLVDMYNDDKLDDEGFEDRIDLLARTTKRMFNQDRDSIEEERENFANQQRLEHEGLKKSASLSVKNLTKEYPDFSRSEIGKIKNILVNGRVDELFMDSDGSYKDEAAELLAYAMYGKKMMLSATGKAERQGESKANLKTVDSSPKSVRRQKSADQKRGVNLDAVGHLSSAFKKDPYA